MEDFRKVTPFRRTNVENSKDISKYKNLLRQDFNERCGYCGDHEFFRDSFYEIDHFVPKKYLKTISETEYSNLVYSCRACNNFKRAKWPTQDENIHNNGKEGFIDPCNSEYTEQFKRINDGSIYPVTDLGSWMWSALNLGNPIHRIKWKLEQVRCKIMMLRDLVDTNSVDDLKLITEMSRIYFDLEEQLKGVPSFNK